MADVKNKQDVKWTPAQADAIYDNGGTLLVSAAAGSGKTAVLVERAVRLMLSEENPIAADRILIVTFTRAAAEELRGRIGARLSEEIINNPNSIHLKKQKILLGRANICTIDSYCMQLLQRYFSELHLPPDFGLADDAIATSLRQKAMVEVLESLYDDESFCEFASLYGRARSDSRATDMVFELYDFSRSLPHPHKMLNELCCEYENPKSIENTLWGKKLLSQAKSVAENAIKLTKTARQMVQEEEKLACYDLALAEDMAFLIRLCELIDSSRWDDAFAYCNGFTPPRLKSVRGYEGSFAEIIKELRSEVKDAVKQIQEKIFICTQEEFLADANRIAPMLRSLVNGVFSFEKRFYELKLEEKLLEYSDFEHLSLKLLCDENNNKTKLAHVVSKDFDAVMVDEYQDTNALQELLYKCLANEDESNLFFVGDVKQSIYRFRLASPEIFIEKRESFSAFGNGKKHPATIVLGHNFRSSESIINQINDVFNAIMSRQVGDVEYTAEEALQAGLKGDYNGTPMEIKIIETGGEEAQDGDAVVVADTIAKMLESKFAVREKSGGERPCVAEDFCILLRTRSKFLSYVAALTKRGVPVFADTGESWLTSPEVAPLLSLLRIIDNPGQDVHLTAVLLSPLFNFTPDDITTIRATCPKGKLLGAILQSETQKAMEFCKTLQELRTLAVTLPIDELCAEIFAKTHYFAAVGAMENGVSRRDSLRTFTQFATSITQGNTGGLSAFLYRVDSAMQSGGASMLAASPAKGCVSIMTIHRSKGLEFPVCILADSAHGFNLRDTSNNVLFHPQLGVGFKLKEKQGAGLFTTAMHAAISLEQKKELVSEEMRILYVALTRARDKLIVTVPIKDPVKALTNYAISLSGTNGIDEYTLSVQRSFSAWLCYFALLHPNGGALRKEAQGLTLPFLQTKGEIVAEIVSSGAVEEIQNSTDFVRACLPDEELLKELINKFEQSQKRQEENVQIPAKVSVSSITHGAIEPVLSRPAFLYKEGLTAAESGTAQHAFLQYANFENAKNNLQQEINRLVEKGFLAQDIAEKLPENRIEAFLKTQLCQRIISAKQCYKEYDFITAIKAEEIVENALDAQKNTEVLVQGIADVVCVNGTDIEIVDYKTDKKKTKHDFVRVYSKQLCLYAKAIEKRFKAKTVKCTIYSFELETEINVPYEI